MTDWIPVTEKLPENLQPVLATYKWISPSTKKSKIDVWIGIYLWRGAKLADDWFDSDCDDSFVDDQSEEIDGQYYVKPGWWRLEDDCYASNMYCRCDGVTHWMPLPKPPEGKG
jgi:hypothetical protein